MPLIVTVVPPSEVENVPFQLAIELARFMPKIDTHSPDWIVLTLLKMGTIRPGVIDGAFVPPCPLAGEQ